MYHLLVYLKILCNSLKYRCFINRKKVFKWKLTTVSKFRVLSHPQKKKPLAAQRIFIEFLWILLLNTYISSILIQRCHWHLNEGHHHAKLKLAPFVTKNLPTQTAKVFSSKQIGNTSIMLFNFQKSLAPYFWFQRYWMRSMKYQYQSGPC